MPGDRHERDLAEAEAVLAGDPVVAAAFDAHGMAWGHLPWDPSEAGGHEVSVMRCGTAPQLHADDVGYAHLIWTKNDRDVHYATGRTTATVTLIGMPMPGAVLAALIGRTLDAAVDLPGAADMTIVDAIVDHQMGADAPDTRIRVERAAGGNRDENGN